MSDPSADTALQNKLNKIRELLQAESSNVFLLRLESKIDKQGNPQGGLKRYLQDRINELLREEPFETRLAAMGEINAFFDDERIVKYWMKDPENWQESRRICKFDEVFNKTEVYVLLLKYLQGGENTQEKYQHRRDEIAETFGVSRKTIDAYITELCDGAEILGTRVKIDIRRRDNNYDDTIHPVFLALNLSEVYLLTVAMRKLMETSGLEGAYTEIVKDIYSQLSEYAREKIDQAADRDSVDLSDVKACRDKKRANRKETINDWHYYLKSGERCAIEFDNDIGKIHYGKIRIIPGSNGFGFMGDEGEVVPLTDSVRILSLKAAPPQ